MWGRRDELFIFYMWGRKETMTYPLIENSSRKEPKTPHRPQTKKRTEKRPIVPKARTEPKNVPSSPKARTAPKVTHHQKSNLISTLQHKPSFIARLANKVLDTTLFMKVLALAKPFKGAFWGTTLLAIILAVLAPLSPYLIQKTVDGSIATGDGAGLQRMVLLLFAVLMVNAVCRYLFIFSSNWLGQSIIRDLRVRVFQHIASLRLRFFDNTPIGTATTRTINDVEAINNIFAAGIINIIADVLTVFVVLTFMLTTDWKLTLVSLSTFPFFVYATYVFKEGVKKTFEVVRNEVSRMNAFLQERISGMSIIQIFSAEETELKKFRVINEGHKQANVKAIWYYSIFFPVIEIILASALGLMVWFGANLVVTDQASLGILIAFILYINMLFRPLRMLADKFNTLQMGLVAADRVFTILETDEKIVDEGTIVAKDLKGQISFKNVWFAYNEVDMVIRDVSFELEAGQTMAIVGATGAGKSSVINILNRFYEIQEGTICIDGVDVRDYELASLRSNIGLVLQDVFLFSGSVMENITLRNPEITEEQVYEASKIVGAHDFIMKLPGQYDYNVMERGATLSLGQRQLISFIRTLVFDPRILILDEATSSIDTETELLVQNAIEKLVKGRTSIVIAHRLSTIQHADQIMVLDKGKVMEIGNHQQLLKKEGYYRKLHDMQFVGEQE